MTEQAPVELSIQNKLPLWKSSRTLRIGIPPKKNTNFDFKDTNYNTFPTTHYQLSHSQSNKAKENAAKYQEKLTTTQQVYSVNELGNKELIFPIEITETDTSSNTNTNEQNFNLNNSPNSSPPSSPEFATNFSYSPPDLSNNQNIFHFNNNSSPIPSSQSVFDISSISPLPVNTEFYFAPPSSPATPYQFHVNSQNNNFNSNSFPQNYQQNVNPFPQGVNFNSNLYPQNYQVQLNSPCQQNGNSFPQNYQQSIPDISQQNNFIPADNSNSLFNVLKRKAQPTIQSSDHFHTINTDSKLKKLSKSEMNTAKDGEIKVTDARITCTFYNKLNLIELNHIILEYLSEKSKQSRFNLEDKRNNILEANSRPQSILDFRCNQKKMLQIDEEISKIDDNINSYTKETKELIEEYAKYFSQTTMFDINIKNETPEVKLFRHNLINEFTYHAKKYVDLIVEKEKLVLNCCSGCSASLDNVQEDINGYVICPQCFVEQDNICNQTYQDEEHNGVVIVKDSSYQNKENFMLIILEFQGIEDFNMPSDLISKLDRYFTSIGGITHEQAYKLPMNPDGTRQGTSRVDMMTALEKTKFQRLYRNCRLICKIYWGWTLPNIMHLYDLLIEDYVASEKAFQQIKDDDDTRKSCLNAHFRAWKLLNRRGFTCLYTDFKPIETEEILRYHEKKWAAICTMLKWQNCKF